METLSPGFCAVTAHDGSGRRGDSTDREGGMEGKGRENKGLGRKEGPHPIVKGLKDIKSFWESDYSTQSNELKSPM